MHAHVNTIEITYRLQNAPFPGSDQRILQLLLFFLLTGAPFKVVMPPPPPFLVPGALPLELISYEPPRTAVSIAVSNISCTPVISFDEHSMYMALIFLATSAPCALVTGVRPCVLRSSIHVRLLRRSDLRPQRIMGVVGQKWRTSGYHCGCVRDEVIVEDWHMSYLIKHVFQ